MDDQENSLNSGSTHGNTNSVFLFLFENRNEILVGFSVFGLTVLVFHEIIWACICLVVESNQYHPDGRIVDLADLMKGSYFIRPIYQKGVEVPSVRLDVIADLFLFMLVFASSRSVMLNALVCAVLIYVTNEDVQLLSRSLKVRVGGSVSNLAIGNWSSSLGILDIIMIPIIVFQIFLFIRRKLRPK